MSALPLPRAIGLPRLPRFSSAELLFSLKSFAAAMLAMYVASRAGLPRPFWALLTSYVVAAPLAGNVRSKALFRFCGTLIGCVAVVLMVPALSDAPELLALALALWVGACLYLSLLDRTARSYVFMLAGYTAALIGFPSVETPLNLFDNAVARVEEIGLGILCATLVHSVVLPVGLGPTLLGLLDRSLLNARQWFTDVLQPPPAPDSPDGAAKDHRDALNGDRQRLAGDITQLRLLSTHVPFDTGHLRWTAGAIAAMQDALAALTPSLSGVEDRLQGLLETDGEVAPDVATVVAQTTAWLQADAVRASASDARDRSAPERDPALEALRESLRKLGAEPGSASAWSRALRIGLAVRLDELLAGWCACEALRRRIDTGLTGAATPLRRQASFGNRVLHKDTGLALLSSFAAVLSICLCCAFWILTSWPSGSAAAMMAAVFCSFFATLDDPVPAINNFMKFTILSMPISAIYVLFLLPLVHDFGMLVLICAPVFIFVGLYAGRLSTTPSALAMLVGVAGTLSMHDTTSDVDLSGFLNSTLAQVAGIIVAALVTRIVRTVGADWSAGRIQRATWRDLGVMAGARPGASVDAAYAVRMVDRIALLAPRIAQVDADARNDVVDGALRDLRSGVDIDTLQRLRADLPTIDLGALMREMARLFRGRASGRGDAAPEDLRGRLDAAIASALALVDAATGAGAGADAPSDGPRAAVTALAGLRRAFFPAARAPAGDPDAGAPA